MQICERAVAHSRDLVRCVGEGPCIYGASCLRTATLIIQDQVRLDTVCAQGSNIQPIQIGSTTDIVVQSLDACLDGASSLP